jgi:hypothetical protein
MYSGCLVLPCAAVGSDTACVTYSYMNEGTKVNGVMDPVPRMCDDHCRACDVSMLWSFQVLTQRDVVTWIATLNL